MDIKREYDRWIVNATADDDIVAELKTMDDREIEDAFYRDLTFGTGGLRGVIGAGTNRINIYTIAKASQGLSNYLRNEKNEELKNKFNYNNMAVSYINSIQNR